MVYAQSLAFELNKMGFNIVDDASSADLLGVFAISGIRHDPLVGLITEEAFLEFKDRHTNQLVCTLRARGRSRVSTP